VVDREHRLHAVEHGFELDSQGIAELGNCDVYRDHERGIDDLRLAPVRMQAVPEFPGHPVGVLAYLYRVVQQGLFAFGEEGAGLVLVAIDVAS